MKKSFVKFALAAFVVCLFAGCGTSYFPTINQYGSQTQVVLSQNNFRVVGPVSGETTMHYVCGIGGLSAKAAKENAVAAMFKNANLTGSQTIINISVKSHISTFYIFYMQKTYVATGMVVEFTE